MIYEYRAYYALPGRMPDIQKRFNDVTMKLFAKHGIKVVGFWDTIVGESNELVYICAFDDLAHRQKAWAAFQADPSGSPRARPRRPTGRCSRRSSTRSGSPRPSRRCSSGERATIMRGL